MNKRPLFRQEVLKKTALRGYGSVSINLPVSYKVTAVGLLFFVLLITVFIWQGEFAESYTARGFLNFSQGIASLYAKKSGVIIQRNVRQGDMVHKGDILFVVYTGLPAATKVSDPMIINNLLSQKKLVLKQIHDHDKKLLMLQDLLVKKFISLSEYQKVAHERFELQEMLKTIEMHITQYKLTNEYSIRAMVNGTITNILFDVGQMVVIGKPLAQIRPLQAKLIANIYIPVKKSGFISVGDNVYLSYDAYRQQRFGTYSAVVEKIGESVLTDHDESKPFQIGGPYYRVTARLISSSVKVYGKNKSLRQGMTFSAVIKGPKHKIWQWMLDPLYSFYGNLSS